MKDFAIDIETLSASRIDLPAMVELAAVEFDRETGQIIQEMHERVDLDSALEFGKVNADTLRWWFAQPNANKVMNQGSRLTIPSLISRLTLFIFPLEKARFWAWGSEFDLRVIMGTLETINEPGWINYRSVRDARTYCTELSEQFGIILPTQDPGTKHNALDDAKHCARLVSGVYQQMMVLAEGAS